MQVNALGSSSLMDIQPPFPIQTSMSVGDYVYPCDSLDISPGFLNKVFAMDEAELSGAGESWGWEWSFDNNSPDGEMIYDECPLNDNKASSIATLPVSPTTVSTLPKTPPSSFVASPRSHLLIQQNESPQVSMPPLRKPASTPLPTHTSASTSSSVPSCKASLPVKQIKRSLSIEAVNVLRKWMLCNLSHPYPDHMEKESLVSSNTHIYMDR